MHHGRSPEEQELAGEEMGFSLGKFIKGAGKGLGHVAHVLAKPVEGAMYGMSYLVPGSGGKAMRRGVRRELKKW